MLVPYVLTSPTAPSPLTTAITQSIIMLLKNHQCTNSFCNLIQEKLISKTLFSLDLIPIVVTMNISSTASDNNENSQISTEGKVTWNFLFSIDFTTAPDNQGLTGFRPRLFYRTQVSLVRSMGPSLSN